MESAVLSILQAEDRYTVTLETPRKGPLALAGTVWVGREHRQDILRIIDAVTDLINRQAGSQSPYRGDVSAMSQVCEVASLEEFGQLMYGLFLPPLVQNALRALDVPLIISTNDSQIPWELLHDGQTFLGLREAVARRLMVTRWVAGTDTALTPEPTFLIITNPLGDLPEADAEADELMAMLEARGVGYDLLRGPRATYIGVQQALVSGRYEAIHYTGHAVFDEKHPDRSALLLAGGRRLPASQIEGILKGRPIVFLNACSSARQGDSTSQAGWEVRYTGPQAEGLASAFIAGGAAGFLGAQWPIFDEGSRDFALAFYRALLDGTATGDALRLARAAVRDARPTDATWASFIFYGDPALRIAETSLELIARAEACFSAGDCAAALDILAQVERRGQPPEAAQALQKRIRASQVEKERLDALHREGVAYYEQGSWQKAADALTQVVAAEADYPDAQAKLLEARRQIELAGLLSQAQAHLAARRWGAAQASLERLHAQEPQYPGLAELLAQVQAKLAEKERAGARPPLVAIGVTAATVVAIMVLLFALWQPFAIAPASSPTPSPTATLPTPEPSPTASPVIVIYVTPQPVTPTPTPTPTRPPGWSRLDNLGGAIVRSISSDRRSGLLYIGTWGSGVMRSTDGGQSWHGENKGLGNQHIWTVLADPISPTVVYAGTNGAGVFRSGDGGDTWVQASKGIESGLIYALAATEEGGRARLWAGTGQGKVYVSEDGARSWRATKGQPAAGYINAFYLKPPSGGQQGRLYVGTNVGVFVSTDDGGTWKELPLRQAQTKPDIRDLVGDPQDDKVLYAGVAGEGVYRSRDGGATWTQTNQGMDNVRVRAIAVDPADPRVLYVGTDGGRVFRSSNGGDRWETANAGLAGRSVQALAALPSRLYAGTWGDGVFRSDDGGRNWRAVNNNLNALNVAAVVGDPASRDSIMIAAYGKGVFHTADGGRTWLPRQSGLSTEDIFSLVADPQNPTTLYALTTEGLFKTTDLGAKWRAINAGFAKERPLALAIAPSSVSGLYASAGAGLVYLSDSGGEQWYPVEGQFTQASVLALAVDPRDAKTVFAGASDGLYRSTDGGRTWRKLQTAPIFAIAMDATSSYIFAGTSRAGMLRSTDGGQTWMDMGLEKLDIVTVAIISRQSGASVPTVLAGSADQGVFASRDGGVTWQSLDGRIAPFVQAIAIHPASANDLLVATSNGLYTTELWRGEAFGARQ